ncbi:MAG TPA: phosphoribosylanthranilate isomerase [Solirubrobacterales bacterium]|nr:phosphoribosylanthranilate isomerase [Solirubrobacterales bacterium]
MRVKICGITNLADAEQAVEHGAWAIGLIHADSPRRCQPDAAVEIGAAMRRRVEVAGVFVNPTLEEVGKAVEAAGLTMVQLSGDEGPSFCTEVARRTGAKVIKAVPVSSAADVHAAEVFRTDYHLYDSHHPERRGGTGVAFDWELVRNRNAGVPALVAGGLRPDNVADAIRVAQPDGVDVATGVEAEPGRKDPAKLAAFFEAVRPASRAPA